MIRLIVLLGNKGSRYTLTRHNIAWLFGEYLFRMAPVVMWQAKFHGMWGKLQLESQALMVLKPMTYVNESGRSVGAIARFFALEASQVLVVHDDLELSFLTARIQEGGGLGGHNGLRSIKEHLGSDRFLRLRLGIGRPARQEVASYVLSRFEPLEETLLPDLFATTGDMLKTWVRQGAASASLPITRTLGT